MYSHDNDWNKYIAARPLQKKPNITKFGEVMTTKKQN